VDKVKSFDIMELESGTFFMLLLGISASLLTFSYLITEPAVKAPVVKARIAQVQVPTVEDEILALEQIGANLIISKINEKSDKKVSLKLNKEGWKAGIRDGKNKININMEKIK
jgi:hypothetical protein